MAKYEDSPKPNDAVLPRPDAASTLGPKVALRGELSSGEDLVIRGRFQGSLQVRDHSLFIEHGASVEADIEAAHVSVAGDLTGNISATGRVVLTSDARMKGDIAASKVHIRDGAQFRGSIKMAKAGA